MSIKDSKKPSKAGFMSVVAGILVGALLGVALGYVLWGSQLTALQERIEGLEQSQSKEPESEASSVEESPKPEKPEEEKPKPNEPVRSERGNIIKQIGEEGGMGNPLSVTLTVTNIEIDPICTNDYARTPEHGHFIRLDMDITTDETVEHFGVTGNGLWKMIRPDGSTVNSDPGFGSGYSCLRDSETLPDSIGASEKISGSIVLDVPMTQGIVVLAPTLNFTGSTSGWEWELPSE